MAVFKKKAPAPLPARRRPIQVQESGRRNEIFSYYSRRSSEPANTGRLDAAAIEVARTKNKPNNKKVSLLVWLSVGAVFIIGILLTNLSGQARVTVLANGNSQYFLQDTSVYQQAVAHDIHQSLLNQNKLTIDIPSLQHDITAQYPEIKTVTVHVPFIGLSPSVVLTPYQASFMLTTSAGETYLLDETGRAVISASQLPDASSLHLLTLQDKSGVSVHTGSQAIAGTTVAFVGQVVRVLQSQHVSVANLSLPPNSSELDASIDNQPYIVKFNLQGDPLLQAGTFVAVKRHLDSQHTVPAAYIDVRVPERAYYK